LRETLFITGFPGFIADRLLERLARFDCHFLLLVQPAFAARAKEEIARIANLSGKPVDEFEIVEGDITHAELGLTPANALRVRKETTRVFHLAAIYDLAVKRELGLHVNMVGTMHVLQFAQLMPQLRHFHYVSTCYVAGKREGVILETELHHDAGYRNFYEESKYLAETQVEAAKKLLPITIHRPAVVCGDSKTGETTKYDGVYYLIHYLLRSPWLSAVNIGNSEVSLNLVPVDFVVDAMAALTFEERAIGKTVQLADPSPLTTQDLFNSIARTIDGSHSRITAPRSWVYFFLRLPPSPRITGLPHDAVPYFFVKQLYDTSQAQQLLEPHGIRCPPFESYVDKIIEFVRQNPTL
jgi:thioester reductase-like protein